MNCPESKQLLQDRLDGLPLADPAGLERHLRQCPECRSYHAAADRLLEGLRRLKPPAPPAGLQAVVVQGVLADRDRRLVVRRRLLAVAALAAGLLLAVATLGPWLNRPAGPAVVATPATTPASIAKLPDQAPPTPPSIRDGFTTAGVALLALTRRTADETVGQTRLLIPEKVPPPLPVPEQVPGIDAPVQGVWASTGQGISAGLEPLANSARRAFSMLLRENPDEKR